MLLQWIKSIIFVLFVSFSAAVFAADTNTPSNKQTQLNAGQKLGFMSSNPITFQQLMTKKDLQPQPVWGFLSMPKATGKQKLPAVIMLPGAGGLKPWYNKYVKLLNEQGIATFQIDSFSPRGLNDVANNQAQLPIPMLVADAYGALQYLAKEPNINARKIAVMGWSLGGLVSITTAFDDLNEAVLDKRVRFAAHIAFYPACNLIYPDNHLDGSPWLYLHGGGDDYTQPSDCLNLIGQLRNSAVINAVLYPHANHGFDNPRPVEWLADVQNPKNCYGVLSKDWAITERTTGASINTPEDYQKAYNDCMLHGAHVGFDQKASDDALWQVAKFLQHYLINNKNANSSQ